MASIVARLSLLIKPWLLPAGWRLWFQAFGKRGFKSGGHGFSRDSPGASCL